MICDQLRDAAAHGLTFAVDPATHDRCTLGGMIGNNSCGTHSVMGGKTADNVIELDVTTYDGARMTAERPSDDQFQLILRGGERQAEIYRYLADLTARYRPLIKERFPEIPRRVSGYNLADLLPESGFDVAKALLSSEATSVLDNLAKHGEHITGMDELPARGFDGFISWYDSSASKSHG